MEYWNLIIRKCYDRKRLAKFFRDTYPVSLLKAFQMTDSLPFEDKNFFGEESSINSLYGAAEFVFIKNESPHDLYAPCPMIFPPLSPEEEEYIEAIKWYNTLSDTDQRKIDILTGRVKRNEIV